MTTTATPRSAQPSSSAGTAPSWPGADPTADPLTGPGLGSLSLAALLADSAVRHPDRTAIVCGAERVSYADLWAQTRAYAGALRARGVRPGDRVAVLVPNVPDFPRVYFAVLALGAVVVPVHLLFTAEEVEHVVRDSGAVLVVAAAPALPAAVPAAARAGVDVLTLMVPAGAGGGTDGGAGAPATRLEDEAAAAVPVEHYAATSPLAPATILYTSGTTGRPKGAVGSHLAIVEQVSCALIDSFDVGTGDVVFGGLPLFHTFGQVCVMNVAFRVGATVLLLPRFDAARALELMDEHRATVFMAVPTMYIGLLAAAPTSAHRPPLRFGVSGGAALPVAVLESFVEVFGAPVHEGYGLTETSPVATFNRVADTPVPGTVGTSLWGVDVEIADAAVDDAVRLLPRGELGEVVVRGHALFKGYLGQPQATAAAVVDGWFRTGDLGTKDDAGLVRIVDRKKDMIIRNGYNVYPTEVEGVLVRAPGVGSVAVFGVPDPVHGQEVHAAVVPAAGAHLEPEDVIDYARERVAGFKRPRVVHVVDALPMGPSGKVLKRLLAQQHDPGADAGRTPVA